MKIRREGQIYLDKTSLRNGILDRLLDEALSPAEENRGEVDLRFEF